MDGGMKLDKVRVYFGRDQGDASRVSIVGYFSCSANC